MAHKHVFRLRRPHSPLKNSVNPAVLDIDEMRNYVTVLQNKSKKEVIKQNRNHTNSEPIQIPAITHVRRDYSG